MVYFGQVIFQFLMKKQIYNFCKLYSVVNNDAFRNEIDSHEENKRN